MFAADTPRRPNARPAALDAENAPQHLGESLELAHDDGLPRVDDETAMDHSRPDFSGTRGTARVEYRTPIGPVSRRADRRSARLGPLRGTSLDGDVGAVGLPLGLEGDLVLRQAPGCDDDRRDGDVRSDALGGPLRGLHDGRHL